MERVVVICPILGLCGMAVCAVADATDEEIIEACNQENPSGTQCGWTIVERSPGDKSPMDCNKYSFRTHFIVQC